MNIKKIKSVIDAIESADAYTLFGDFGYSPLLNSIAWLENPLGIPNREVLTFIWDGEDGRETEVTFTERNLSDAVVDSLGVLIMRDKKGKRVEVSGFELKRVNFGGFKDESI